MLDFPQESLVCSPRLKTLGLWPTSWRGSAKVLNFKLSFTATRLILPFFIFMLQCATADGLDDVCFTGAYTEERCCARHRLAANMRDCWSTEGWAPVDAAVAFACCLNLPNLADWFDPPASPWIRSDLEEQMACRTSRKWSRFRRLILSKLVLDDAGLTPEYHRIHRVVRAWTHHVLFENGERMISVAVNDSSSQYAGSSGECILGQANALLIYVLAASHACLSFSKEAKRNTCLSSDDRTRLLSMSGQFLVDASETLELPHDMVFGLLASAPWPFRRLHALHLHQNPGELSARPWVFGFSASFFVSYGGFDIQSLSSYLSGSNNVIHERYPDDIVHVLVASRDWGGIEIASSLSHLLERMHISLFVDAGMSPLVDRLPEGVHRIWGKAGDDSAIPHIVARADVVVATSIRMGLRFLQQFDRPTIIYYWDVSELHQVALHTEWARVRACDRFAHADFGFVQPTPLACLLVAASVLLPEMIVTRAGFAPPVARPICLFALVPSATDQLPPVVLTVSTRDATWRLLQSLAQEVFPLRFHELPVLTAWAPPEAIGAVLWPWALWMPSLPELYAVEIPIFVPAPDYLAEFVCAKDTANFMLAELEARRSVLPPISSMTLDLPRALWRTRCGSSLPTLAAFRNSSTTSQVRLVVEFSELTHWPGLHRFSSLAELFAQLVSISQDTRERDTVVSRMRSFNRDAQKYGKFWWSNILQILVLSRRASVSFVAQPVAPYRSTQSYREEKRPHSFPKQRSCTFPKPFPGAAMTPMKRRHVKLMTLFASLETQLWRAGLQYSVAFGTLLGAVRHAGLVKNEHDLDVYVGLRAHRSASHRYSASFLARDGSRRKGLVWLCHLLRTLVRRKTSSRHRFIVLCSGTREARSAREAHVALMNTASVPACPESIGLLRDPWYAADQVGIYETDPVAARLMVRSTSSGVACIGHFLDVYVPRRIFQTYGPVCKCVWERIPVMCLNRWDAYLRDEYGSDYMTPRALSVAREHDMIPCPLDVPEMTRVHESTNQKIASAVSELRTTPSESSAIHHSKCWKGGFVPQLCCHPKFGPYGNLACWGGAFDASTCCDERTWTPAEVYTFCHVLANGWQRTCELRNQTYIGTPTTSWYDGKRAELIFFWYYLRAGFQERRHTLEIAAALAPSTPLDRQLQALLQRDAFGRWLDVPRQVRVLDVGSGPLSMVGRVWPGVDVDVVAVDPLACEYEQIRQDLGMAMSTIIPATFGEAESLSSRFGTNQFDIVHCTNALDHAFDPVRAVLEILRVVRVGRPVLLRHRLNEGTVQNYSGLHQWNFDERNGRFIIWTASPSASTRTEIDIEAELVREGLAAVGGVRVRRMDAPYAEVEGEGVGLLNWIEAVIWKSPF